MGIFSFLFGKHHHHGGGGGSPPTITPVQRFSPDQEKMLDAITSDVHSTTQPAFHYLRAILQDDPESFKTFAAPYVQSFEQQVIPGILDQIGNTAGLRSSFLGQQLGQAATALEDRLAAQHELRKQAALDSYGNLAKLGLEPKTQHVVTPGSPGIMGSAFGGLAAGSALGAAGSALGLLSKFLPLAGLFG